MSAGKGDRPRPVIKKQYDENFDKIKWEKKEICNSKKKNGIVKYTYK